MHAVRLLNLDVGEADRVEKLLVRGACVSAPAMQPAHASAPAHTSSVMSGSAMTSVIANRPPGRRTRAASPSTVALSGERLMRDHDVDGLVWERDVLKEAFEPGHVGDGGVVAGKVQHLVGHVEPVGEPG